MTGGWSCLVLGLVSAVAHAAGDPLRDVMELMAARRHGAVNFEERRFLSLLKKPLDSSGTLIYDAPDRLEKRTLLPNAESLRLDGGVLTVERNHRRHVVDLKSYPQVLPFIEGIRATLAGDRAALERVFQVQFSGEPASWSLQLTPLDASIGGTVALVRIEGTQADLRLVDIREVDGDRSLMTLAPPDP